MTVNNKVVGVWEWPMTDHPLLPPPLFADRSLHTVQCVCYHVSPDNALADVQQYLSNVLLVKRFQIVSVNSVSQT